MARAYSADLRERVLAGCEAGLGRAEAARRYRVGERTVYRWLREAHHEGRRHAKPPAGGRRPAVAGTEGALRQLVAARRDATLAEQAEAYAARTGRTLSPSALCRALQRLGLPRKKDPARHGAGPGRDPGRAGRVHRAPPPHRPAPAGVRR